MFSFFKKDNPKPIPTMDKDAIVAALRTVQDPQTGQDLVTAGLVQDIQLNGQQVNLTLSVPSLQMHGKAELNFACIGAIVERFPEAVVDLHFVARTPTADVPPSALPQVKNIIAVGSGKGGVGKSTVAVNLALGLQKLGARVGIMDADVYGPSIPTMLGLVGQRPEVQDLHGKMKMVPLDAYGLSVISIGNIIEPEQAVVLRGPRLAGVIKQFVNDVVWPALDFLVIDLPPGTGDVQLSLVQTVPLTGAVLVTTPQQVAVSDAIKAMNMFKLPQIDVPILGIVENMAWFTPAELPENKYYIFGQGGGKQLALAAGTVLLGQVPLVQSIREGGDAGTPAVVSGDGLTADAFIRVAQNTLRQVAIRNETIAPTRIVQTGP